MIYKTLKNNRRKDGGFTLIELLVVIAIIALLSSVVLNSLASARMKANDAKVAEDLRQVKNAVELYYTDNHSYPLTAVDYQPNKTAVVSEQNNSWANKLSFFVKTAKAAGGVSHTTPLCNNFDVLARKLVDGKYLSTIPVHPYDNDAGHVCYKSVSSATTLSVYGVLSTQMTTAVGSINKRVGFVAGDLSDTGMKSLGIATALKTGSIQEIVYPSPYQSRAVTFGSDPTQIVRSYASISLPRTGYISYDSILDTTQGVATIATGVNAIISFFNTPENTYALCHDNKDNDENGFTDMTDSSCAPFTGSENTYSLCHDGLDNDGNSYIDSLDSGCALDFGPENTWARCNDRIDNDGNGVTDSGDTSCADVRPCPDGQMMSLVSNTCQAVFTETRVNSATCEPPSYPDLFSDSCITDGN